MGEVSIFRSLKPRGRMSREEYNAYQRDWRQKNPDVDHEYQRRSRYKQKYGITTEHYDALLALQNGKCALCDNGPETERYKRLNVDHCHETGAIRGLLCTSCNHALGRLGDTAARMERVLAYLRRAGA